MKKAILSIILLPLVTLAQSPFTVTGSGKAFKDGDKIYLVYKLDDSIKADSTVVANGEFKFKGLISGQAKGTLYKNENPLTAEIVHDTADLYIEQGNIMVTSPDSLKHAIVSGTPTNEDLMVLSLQLEHLQQKRVKILTDFDALPPGQQKDINKVAAFREQLRNVNKEMEPVQFAFIESHTNSYISLITLSDLKRNGAPVQKVEEAYNGLTLAIKETPMGKSLGSAIASAVGSALGSAAPDFTQADVNGKPIKLSDFRGKYVLVDFWASWCSPCRAENPNIVAAYKKYNTKGFAVLGVSLDDQSSKEAWLKAIKNDGLFWAQVSDLKGWKNEVATLYGITSIPANVLVDPSGKIVARNVTDLTLLNTLEELLSEGVKK